LFIFDPARDAVLLVAGDKSGRWEQRVSAIESGAVAELATLGDYIRALGGELKVIADFGDSRRRVA
jgi:hypothetical protein